MFTNGMRPVHPGEILREEYLHPMDLSPAALAKLLNVSAPTVNDIVRGRRNISADVALRLAACFDTSPQFWANLQSAYDLRKAEIDHGAEIAQQVQRAPECA
ncbi:virulence-associated protein [Pseudomonas chlororaphis subsp. aurantiaca]|uniref:HigA family addiction module antitoxin n=2 Tax=Pseudomonas TaxID=286 RepID=UPI0008650E37|nr:HigA family addiction module antitoxin [Pseudomonas chlororaphis]BAV74162.1 virulence-associated protein [Pseudomonas chlororaphis subsp. aurantiaca]